MLCGAAGIGSARTADAASADWFAVSSSDGDVAMGGGSDYDDAVSPEDASTVVGSTDELAAALDDATAGDVVFVAGDATLDTGDTEFDVPAGVTVASDRGAGKGALLRTDEEPDTVFHLAGEGARLTGLRLRGPFPDSDVSHGDGISFDNRNARGVTLAGGGCEVDNTEIVGFGYAGVYVTEGGGASNRIHHNYIHQNNTQGLGYGVSAGGGANVNPTIEYNYFDENRHSVAASGDNHGYVCRYNHFGPTHVMHVIDVHDPGATDTVIEGNVVESTVRTWDDNCCPAVGGCDGTKGTIRIAGNWFWNGSCTYSIPVDEEGIETADNTYGSDADVRFGDVIPDHPGADDRPWA